MKRADFGKHVTSSAAGPIEIVTHIPASKDPERKAFKHHGSKLIDSDTDTNDGLAIMTLLRDRWSALA